MIYEMSNKLDQQNIAQYGKAQGTLLLKKWLPNVNRTRNLFIIDSYEEFKKIADKLPEVFSCRADAKTGDNPTWRCRGEICQEI